LNVGRWTFALHCAAAILYILALLTKPASISLPLMIAVIDLLILGQPARQALTHAILWLTMGLPIVLLTRYFQDVSSLQQSPLWSRPAVALDAIGFYLRKLLLPIRLTPDYGRTPGWVLVHTPQMAVSILIASCTLLAAWLGRNRTRWITASVGLLLAALLPYLGLAQFDFQHISTVADRYAYLGMTGVAIFTAGISMRSKLATLALLIICCIWAVLSHEQATRWRDDATLFTYALEVNPDSLLAHSAIGYRAANQTPPDDSSAEFNYRAALRVWPQDAEVLFNLGNLYLRHDPAAAVEQYQRAIANQPRMPEYHNNLAVAFAKLGQFQNACTEWQRAIDLAPNDVDAHNNRGDLYRRMNQPAAAIADYKAVLQIDPNNEYAAAMLLKMGATR
jgi:Tfp pilus assembly protein PilF